MGKEADKSVTFPLVMAIARTRALGGVGLGLLLAGRMDNETRRTLGVALLAGSIASTVPLLWGVMKRLGCCPPPEAPSTA